MRRKAQPRVAAIENDKQGLEKHVPKDLDALSVIPLQAAEASYAPHEDELANSSSTRQSVPQPKYSLATPPI